MRGEAGRKESGFTLIELLVVLVIIAIVTAIGLVAVMNALDKSKQRATMADMRTVSKGIEVYAVDNGHLPADSDGIAGLKSSLIPYQSSVIPTRDHWGHDFGYRVDIARGLYTVESFGKDGVDGPDMTLATKLHFNSDIVLANGQFVAAPE